MSKDLILPISSTELVQRLAYHYDYSLPDIAYALQMTPDIIEQVLTGKKIAPEIEFQLIVLYLYEVFMRDLSHFQIH